jgi:hypothetical protein
MRYVIKGQSPDGVVYEWNAGWSLQGNGSRYSRREAERVAKQVNDGSQFIAWSEKAGSRVNGLTERSKY